VAGDSDGTANPTRSKARQGVRAARPPPVRRRQPPGRPLRWMVTEPVSRKGPGNRTPPTGRLIAALPGSTCGNGSEMQSDLRGEHPAKPPTKATVRRPVGPCSAHLMALSSASCFGNDRSLQSSRVTSRISPVPPGPHISNDRDCSDRYRWTFAAFKMSTLQYAGLPDRHTYNIRAWNGIPPTSIDNPDPATIDPHLGSRHQVERGAKHETDHQREDTLHSGQVWAEERILSPKSDLNHDYAPPRPTPWITSEIHPSSLAHQVPGKPG